MPTRHGLRSVRQIVAQLQELQLTTKALLSHTGQQDFRPIDFMSTKQIQLILFILGFSSCLIYAADDESKLMQQNPDWHITSEAFSNAPYWLIPTNVPFRLGPLSNGKWVWTTNQNAGWYEQSTLSVTMNIAREQQIHRQWLQRMRETDPPGIANVIEYHSAWNGKYHWNTNTAENWWGVWVKDTNSGWRVNLCPVKTNKTSAVDIGIIVKVGSVVTNSGAGLLPSPDGKYAKLELLDANGKAVPTKRGAALNLYQEKYAVQTEDMIVNSHPPSSRDETVERNYPDTISDWEYPRLNFESSSWYRKGAFFRFTGFVSNGPPCHIGYITFKGVFDIKVEGDYTLTVQPVLFRMHNEGGTFQGYLDRVDLPSVTTKVHLVPNAK